MQDDLSALQREYASNPMALLDIEAASEFMQEALEFPDTLDGAYRLVAAPLVEKLKIARDRLTCCLPALQCTTGQANNELKTVAEKPGIP